MGNTDLTINKELVTNTNRLALDFIQKPILFNVQEIKFPLSTSGVRIVDATGTRVKLAGGNWSGGHLCRQCVDGLQCRPLRDIAMDIRYKFRMNCIRLTYSLQLFYDNKVVPQKYLLANPQLIGKTAVQIFDITIKTLTEVGIMVFLNSHTSTSMWCCSNDDGDGLWWTYQYPQYKFFQNCEDLARRYKDNPLVIGMDLRNQLRKAHGLEATWGTGEPLTDWKRAAKICGEKVLAIAPHWLIIVAGLNYQLDLTPILNSPLQFSVPNKLVYSGHLYSFSWPIASWSLVSYESFKKKLFNTQTFVRGLSCPFLFGQFGNNQRDTYWNYLIKYLKETDIDWTYWPIDGFKCDRDQDETYGIFTNDFKSVRNPQMLNDLISVGPPHGTIIDQNSRIRNLNLQKHQKQNEKNTFKSEIKFRKQSQDEQFFDIEEYHRAKSTDKQIRHEGPQQIQKLKFQILQKQRHQDVQKHQESNLKVQKQDKEDRKSSQKSKQLSPANKKHKIFDPKYKQ